MKIRLSTAMTAAALTFALVASGCDESAQDNLSENANNARDSVSDAVQSGAETARGAFESVKAEYAPQIENMSAQLAALKDKAAEFKDTQLDGYIAELDAKLTQIRSSLSEATADGAANLKENMSTWVAEARDLYEKASARLAELTASAPAGGTDSAGQTNG